MNTHTDIVHDILAANGWSGSKVTLGTTTWYAATKFYPNAAGGRDAVIYLHNGWLSGDYMSEGYNVLAAPTMIGDDVSASTIEFLAEVEHKINQTYARRLMAV